MNETMQQSLASLVQAFGILLASPLFIGYIIGRFHAWHEHRKTLEAFRPYGTNVTNHNGKDK